MITESFNFKTGDIVDCCKLKRMVSKIHYRKQDIWEGDVVDRIEEYSYYELREVSIDDIVDYKDYTTDQEMVDKYSALDYCNMPAIIVHCIENSDTYRLVDGGHRAQACLKQGRQFIKAFVGIIND